MAPKTDTRERLVEKAAELFLYQGYGSTGVAQILRAADAQSGSLYHFFPTKEDLLIAVLERYKEMLWPILLGPIWERVDDPIERIFALLDGYRQMLIETEYAHGCPIGNLALELSESNPKARRLIVDNFLGWLAGIQQCLLDASGRLPEESDPRQLAIFVLTTMEGAVMLARSFRNLDAYDAAVSSLRDYFERLIADGSDWSMPRRHLRDDMERRSP